MRSLTVRLQAGSATTDVLLMLQVATEWLFSVPEHVLEKHLASDPNTPTAEAEQPEDTRILAPRRVPLLVGLNCLCALLRPGSVV